MPENRQLDYFIIITMILTATHDYAIRWPCALDSFDDLTGFHGALRWKHEDDD